MGKILRLSDELANQIAAGEVVERPASVVKELVENAIDAEATRIQVLFEDGGLTRLEIRDDGIGMSPEDAHLALERHATSKLRAIEELNTLRTLGFRGEALPSIASVSRFQLSTRTNEEAQGVELTTEGGKLLRVQPIGMPPGTILHVRDLFFNVPARRKFLKTQNTEAAHILETVLEAALANPTCTFLVLREGKTVREYLRVGTRQERVRHVVDEPLTPCLAERGPLVVEAYLSAPERARAGASALHLFVNGRPVKDRLLARAVAQAYGSVLEGGRYPVGVVYLEIPPAAVDVNVHPQKAEVRFAEPRSVFEAITKGLRQALATAFSVIAPEHAGSTSPPPLFSHAPPQREASSEWTFRTTESASLPPWTFHAAEPFSPSFLRTVVSPDSSREAEHESYNIPALTEEPLAETTLHRQEPTQQALPLPADDSLSGRRPMRFLAQLHGMFLLCEEPAGLCILDQHAAAERVLFETLRKAYAAHSVSMQNLLVPAVLSVSTTEQGFLEEYADTVTQLGFDLRAVGEGAMVCHALPQLLAKKDPERLVRDLLAELTQAARRPLQQVLDLTLATMACHGSIRAGDPVSSAEGEALLKALHTVDFSGHCPHGRPVVIRLSKEELARRVGRT